MAAKKRRRAKKVHETRCGAKVTEPMEEAPERPSLSRAAWHERQGATDLMAHAAPLLARQHLALVLAAIASTAWKHWHQRRPDDWSFAWSIALLRAWALGEVHGDELRRGLVLQLDGLPSPAFVDPTGRPYGSYDDNELSRDVLAACAAAAVRALEVVACDDAGRTADAVLFATACANARAEEVSVEQSFLGLLDLDSELEESEAARGRKRPSRARRRVGREQERLVAWAMHAFRRTSRRSYAASVKTIRALVPWVDAPTTDWRVLGPLIVTGDTLLRVDGWEVLDAVRTDELLQLGAARSVVFDALLERYGAALSAPPASSAAARRSSASGSGRSQARSPAR